MIRAGPQVPARLHAAIGGSYSISISTFQPLASCCPNSPQQSFKFSPPLPGSLPDCPNWQMENLFFFEPLE